MCWTEGSDSKHCFMHWAVAFILTHESSVLLTLLESYFPTKVIRSLRRTVYSMYWHAQAKYQVDVHYLYCGHQLILRRTLAGELFYEYTNVARGIIVCFGNQARYQVSNNYCQVKGFCVGSYDAELLTCFSMSRPESACVNGTQAEVLKANHGSANNRAEQPMNTTFVFPSFWIRKPQWVALVVVYWEWAIDFSIRVFLECRVFTKQTCMWARFPRFLKLLRTDCEGGILDTAGCFFVTSMEQKWRQWRLK